MNAPPEVGYDARLLLDSDQPRDPDSWSISHAIGGPAAGTYTEVQIDDTRHPDEVLEAIVRLVALELYGNSWAFIYRPEQFDNAIGRHGMHRREVVLVEGIEVWS